MKIFWLFVAVFVISTSINTCESAENLTEVVWKHVSTLEGLKNAFNDDKVKVIDVDVIYGEFKGESEPDKTSTETPTRPPTKSSTETPTRPPTKSSTETPTRPPTKSSTETPTKSTTRKRRTSTRNPKSTSTTTETIIEPEYPEYPDQPEYNFYQVVPEESWTVGATKESVIDQNKPTSNLRFEEFLLKALEFSKGHEKKAVKFNFKDRQAVNIPIDLIQRKHREIHFSVWLQADVLLGPNGDLPKITPKEFIAAYNQTRNYELSLGWTTNPKENPENGYTKQQTDLMKKTVFQHVQNNTQEGLNFAVRALYAVKNTEVLRNFYNDVKKVHPKTTLTVWSGEKDAVKADDVTKFIKDIGVENVYINLPDGLHNDLRLGTNSASALIQFGLLNLVTLAVAIFFRNGLN